MGVIVLLSSMSWFIKDFSKKTSVKAFQQSNTEVPHGGMRMSGR